MGFTPVTPPVRTRGTRTFTVDAATATELVNAAAGQWIASDERFPNMKAAIAYGQKIRRDVEYHTGLSDNGYKLRTRTWSDGSDYVIGFRVVNADGSEIEGSEPEAKGKGRKAA